MPIKPSFEPEQFPPGTTIVQQGDMPDKFYIITRGMVEVVTRRPNGREELITTLRAGEYFGEMGLMTQKPRNATVRALTPVNVMTMDRRTFGDWLNSSDVIRWEIESLVQQRAAAPQLQPIEPDGGERPAAISAMFTGFFDMEPLDHVEAISPGQIIVHQGVAADKFYIIIDGVVEVYATQPDGEKVVLEELGRGDYFGEIGLLEGGTRIATVQAKTETRLITFDRETFRSWLQQNPGSHEEIEQTASRRMMDTGRLTWPVSEMFKDLDEE